MLVHKTVEGFIDILASDAPAPGGGSTAALVGSLSAALCAMVCGLTKGEKFSEVVDLSNQHQQRAKKLMNDLKRYIDEDTFAFNKVMQAFQLPKTTEEEKAIRTRAIQKAMKGAADLPLKVADTCLELLLMSIEIIKFGNPNAASDVAVGGVMAYAALQGAVYNVKINLGSIKDEAYVSDVKEKLARLLSEATAANTEILLLAERAIG